jgi:hypothetical protein
MNEDLLQALELQAMLLAARPHEKATGPSEGATRPPAREQTQDNQHAGAVKSQATSGVVAPMKGRKKMTTGARNMMRGLKATHENRPSNNREVDRKEGQLSGNKQGPAEEDRHWCIH